MPKARRETVLPVLVSFDYCNDIIHESQGNFEQIATRRV